MPSGPSPIIYMDYQATTPIDPRVRDMIWPFFDAHFGNPHSTDHSYGWKAEEAVNRAREQVASVIGAEAREIIFTSGATESNNLAIKGISKFHLDEAAGKRNQIITFATEHKAVLAPCESLRQNGFEVTVLPVLSDGLIDLTEFEAQLSARTLLVSAMAVNNEIGVIQNLTEIGRLCRNVGALFHTDAAQGFGKIPIDVNRMQIDLLSISGHKIYGPMGIGALYLRRRPRVRLLPLISGGGQEMGLRPGTIPLPLAVGLGAASEIADKEMEGEERRLTSLRDLFLAGLQPVAERFRINGSLRHRIPGNVNLSFPEMKEDDMLRKLRRLAVSTGSACNSGNAAPSYVLQAIGLDEATAKTSIRFGFGRFTTNEDVEAAVSEVIKALA